VSHHLDPGHTVIALPVDELDHHVRARTVHYDAAYAAADPRFGQAHVTLLAPWVRAPGAADLARVTEILARHRAFEFVLDHVAAFPDGTIHLRVEPETPFRSLTRALSAAYPQHRPYEGRYGDEVTPHLTLDAIGPGVDVAGVAASVAHLLPARCPATRVQLQWWQAGNCHVMHEWQLSTS
jgi:2'-5' RNA ligase